MADEATTESTPATPAETPAQETPWGADFDAAKAWQLVQNLRGDKDKLQSRVVGYEKTEQERSDAEKSETQKAIERAERAEKALQERTKADLKKAALKAHNLDEDLVEFLTGETAEDFKAKASALAAKLGASTKETPAVPGKPQAKLTPGHESSGSGGEFDAGALADKLFNRSF